MNIAYIFWGDRPHPRRELCANSINADFFKIPILKGHPFSSLIYSFFIAIKLLFKRKYNVLLVDSGVALQAAFFLKFFSKKTRVIFYVLEPFFNNFDKLNRFLKIYYTVLARSVDGYLTVSEMIQNKISIYDSKPIKLTIPFLWRDETLFAKIGENSNNNFIYIKNVRNETNHQLLADVFAEFVKKYPNSKLFFIGKETQQKIKTTCNQIELLGYIDSLQYLLCASFYIHPAYFDPGPISLLEAMRLGLIPITTTGVGNYKLVEELDKNLVISDIKKENILKTMEYAINLTLKKRKIYSQKAKKIADRFSREKGIEDFKNKFKSLSEEITS